MFNEWISFWGCPVKLSETPRLPLHVIDKYLTPGRKANREAGGGTIDDVWEHVFCTPWHDEQTKTSPQRTENTMPIHAISHVAIEYLQARGNCNFKSWWRIWPPLSHSLRWKQVAMTWGRMRGTNKDVSNAAIPMASVCSTTGLNWKPHFYFLSTAKWAKTVPTSPARKYWMCPHSQKFLSAAISSLNIWRAIIRGLPSSVCQRKTNMGSGAFAKTVRWQCFLEAIADGGWRLVQPTLMSGEIYRSGPIWLP